MKKTLYFTGAVATIILMYYLYIHQLGAISFFLLSIFFFSLAIRQFRKDSKEKRDKKTKFIKNLGKK